MKKSFRKTGQQSIDAALTHMDNHMSIAGMAYATRQNYVRAARSLALHYSRSPEECDVNEIKAWLVHERDQLKQAP